jgi:SPP1 family predicted phage head-tail adaptor
MLAAGRLDRLVVIERAVTVQDEFGEPVATWSAWKTVFMGKRDIRAEERFRANQELATETTVWTSHYIDGLTPTDRLNVDGLLYDIVGIAELGRRAGMQITATARL